MNYWTDSYLRVRRALVFVALPTWAICALVIDDRYALLSCIAIFAWLHVSILYFWRQP